MELLLLKGTYVSYVWLLQMFANRMTKFYSYYSHTQIMYTEKAMSKKQGCFWYSIIKKMCALISVTNKCDIIPISKTSLSLSQMCAHTRVYRIHMHTHTCHLHLSKMTAWQVQKQLGLYSTYHHWARNSDATDIVYWGMPTITTCFQNRTLKGNKKGTL
jgi:hypothetical protein